LSISRYLEYAVKRYPENNQGGGQGDSSKISYYADPLIETVLYNSNDEMEKITGMQALSLVLVYTGLPEG
jgi:hypothetical protein